jgi:hypothetical protein
MISFIARSILTNQNLLLKIENNFKQISALKEDIAYYPLANHLSTQVETNKDKSKLHGEVFTPLWLVDEMIGQVDWKSSDVRTLDLCAGYGQFSIRLARFFYEKFPDFDLKKFLNDNHAFSELQLESCYKLLCIFSVNINLYIGDSTYLGRLPEGAKGIWVYVEKAGFWVCLTKTIKKLVKEKNFVKNLENIIIKLNEGYDKMSDSLKEEMSPWLKGMSRFHKNRLELFKLLNKATEKTSMQTVDTPYSLVEEMLDQVEEIEKKSILVLFNCEIVECLIHKHKVPVENITFGYDTGSALEAKAVERVYGVKIAEWIKNGPFEKTPRFDLRVFGGKKFDVCLSNPPYNDHLHLKILSLLINNATETSSIAKEYIVVHPANWIIDCKETFNTFVSFKNLTKDKIKSIHCFNGNKVFNIDLFYPCSISHFDFSKNFNKINVQFFDEKFTVNNINDITKYGQAWFSLVNSFVVKITNATRQDNVWKHNVKNLTVGKSYCQLAAIMGNHSKDKNLLTKSDFYTMVQKSSDNNKGIRKSMDKRPGPTFEFDHDFERDNFLEYLKTDFARFCLSVYKVSGNIFYGEMELIPWLDFTQSWDDEKLFKHFDVNEETQKYIREFLPDYYGIRK